MASLVLAPSTRDLVPLELETKVREVFTITEQALLGLLKAPTSAITFQTLLRPFAI